MSYTKSESNFQGWYTHLPGSEHLLSYMENIGTKISVPKNHTIVKAGVIPDCCYIVTSGIVTGYELTATGEERMYNFDHFGKDCIVLLDVHVLTNHPVPVSIRTQTETELICITRNQLLEGVQKNSDFAIGVMLSTSYKFLSAFEQLRESRCNKAFSITGKLFLGLAHRYGTPHNGMTLISRPFTQQELANLLGVNRITFVRTLKQLRELGLINNIGRLYCIPSIEKLTEFVKQDEPYV